MTVKTLTSIELGDIKTIEFECGKCHTRTAFPIEKFRYPVTVCNVCEPDRQLLIDGGEELSGIVKLGQLIQRLSRLDRERFIMRFEIADVSPEEA